MKARAVLCSLALLGFAAASDAQSSLTRTEQIRTAITASDFETVLQIAARWVAELDSAGGTPNTELATAKTYRYIAQRNLGALGAAEADARAVLELMTALRGELTQDTITSLGNLAGVRLLRGDLLGAEALYREGLSRLERLSGVAEADLARGTNNLAVVLRQQGEWAEAELLYRRALTLATSAHGATHRTTAIAQRNLASTLLAQGKFAPAREALRAAREAYGSSADSLRLAATWFIEAELELEAGDLRAAEAAARAALELRQRALREGSSEIARTRVLWAEVKLRAADAQAAASLAESGLADLQRVLGEHHPDVVRARVVLGQAQLALGDATGAIATLEPAATAYEIVLRSSAAGIDRASVDLSSPYPSLARAYLLARRELDAWVASELSHAKVLTEVLDLALGKMPDETLRERARLSRQLEDRRTRLEGMAPSAAEFAAARQELLAAEAAWAQFEQRIASLQGVDATQIVRPAAIAKLLQREELLVGWIDGWVWSLDAQGKLEWFACRQGARARELRQRVLAARTAPAFAPPSEDAELVALEKEVAADWFEPLWPRLRQCKRLWLIPHAQLVGLPPALLRDDKGISFVDRWSIALLPSASVWQRASAAAPGDGVRRAFFFGGIPAEQPTHVRFAQLPPLQAAARELKRCPPLAVASDVLVGARASEARLQELAHQGALAKYSLLHFATHAESDADRPGRSALMAVADAPAAGSIWDPARPGHDGAVSAVEIADTWRLRAELVTLSACETALGREVAGEGYVGIAQSFFQAGAQALLISQWAVDDEATALLMEEFYSRWLRGGEDAASALRGAQLTVRSTAGGRYSHPYYWAAFTLVGGSRR